jgi:hypothetical protein
MATKVEWGASDKAAQQVLDEVIAESGYAYRKIEELSGGALNYNRVRDIRLGRRAPVRLSEFLGICAVCAVDAIKALQIVIDRAHEIEKGVRREQYAKDESDAEDMIKSFSKGDNKTFGLAADIEKDKWLEARGGDGR